MAKEDIRQETETDSAAPHLEEDTEGQPQVAESALEEAAPERVIPPGAVWYVVHCYSGYENKVKKNLEHRIESMGMQNHLFQVVVPTEEEIELREGKRRTVERRLFPGYILVQMLPLQEGDPDSDRAWSVVRNTPGVTGFVGAGTRPTSLPQEEVDKILKRMASETPRIKISFRPGETVRIIEGPFADFMGSVDKIYPEKGKVRILVSFFGRETPLELDFLQVEKG